MGTVANLAGSYFKAMLVGMPFVDVINTMIGAHFKAHKQTQTIERLPTKPCPLN